MKTRLVLLIALFITAVPVFGIYAPYFTDPMSSYQSAYWIKNGSISFSYNSSGGYTDQYGTASFISTVAIPDGSSSCDVQATVHGTLGWNLAYYLYLRASTDAFKNGVGTGTFYAVGFLGRGLGGVDPGMFSVVIYKRA